MLAAAAERLRALAGWRRALAAAGFGALAALALPPLHLVPALVPAFVGLLWLLEGACAGRRRAWRGFLTGFWFGLGHFMLGLHWIAEPLLVDPARTAWMIPFAVPGVGALLAVFPAAACGIFAAWRPAGAAPARVLGFAGLWLFAEWLRGFVLTGFPWNLVGYAWSGSVEMLQASAAVGILGLGGLTVVMAAMPAVLAETAWPVRRPWGLAVLATCVLPALLWAGGAARLAGAADATVPDVRLRIVQANIAQRDKWREERRVASLDRHVALSREADGPPPTHVIWPETAVPFLLANDPLARIRAVQAVAGGGVLLTGTVRTAFHGGARRLFNSMLVVDAQADIGHIYDKAHLVPFGEYVPLRGILPIDRIVPGQGDFTPGGGRELLQVSGLPPASPLICYEAIFPGRVTPDGARPGWLLNLTNDAWFGTFAGPQQHFAIASARAVEEGLPMVRAANTGISAVVDPYGRVLARLDIGVAGVLDSDLPAALEPTPYARWGDAIPTILALLFLGGALVFSRARESA
jgi:apolipoprotein N-acyltransferase